MIRKVNGQNLRITANGQVGAGFACATETILGSVTIPPRFSIHWSYNLCKKFV